MNRKTLEELAAGYALGALDSAEAAQLEALMAHDARAREEVASFIDAAAALVAASVVPVAPSPEQRARILAAIADTPQLPGASQIKSAPAGFSMLPGSEEGWTETEVPGLRMKFLSGKPGADHQVILAELAAGGRIPEHDHQGSEELFILSGHLHTEGYVLGPGDFFRAEAGTHHQELISPGGCRALLIYGPAVAV